ncbi:MAG: O-antigen ligase [Desulforhopalus sp.]|jgi:O-antigen ligase
MNTAKITSNIESVGLYSLIASCFFIPFSSSLMGATSILALICWVISGKISILPKLIVTNKLVFLAAALFTLMIAGLFYSPAETKDALSSLKKYRELLLFIMAISYLKGKEDKAALAEKCFVAGSILLLSISYAMYFGLIPTEKYGYSTVYHITHSFFMATLAFWALQRLINSPGFRFFWTILLTTTSINLFYIAPGRTGMFVSIALVILTVFQHLSLKKSILGLLLCIFTLGAAFYTSHNFSSRMCEAMGEIQNYQPGVSRTSLGMRFDWWHNSVTLIKEKPLLGHGTGSFESAQATLIRGTKTMKSDNPHNEFLLIGVQVGLVGVGLYIALLGGLFIASFKKERPANYLLQGVVVAMFCGCLMNSFLFDSHPGHFFAIMSAVLLSTQTKDHTQRK